jgi:hypothetical protein
LAAPADALQLAADSLHEAALDGATLDSSMTATDGVKRRIA